MITVTVEAQLRAALLGTAFGTAVGGRLWQVAIPAEPVYPCASFQRISTKRQYSQSQSTSALGWCRFSFSIWDQGTSSLNSVAMIAEKLRDALQGFNATTQPQAQGPNFLINQHVEFEPDPQPPVARCIADYQVWFADQ